MVLQHLKSRVASGALRFDALQEAAALRQRLIKHYGESHPVMLEVDRLARFQRFRLTKSRPEGA